jgi:hypothetical protein
MEVRVLCVVKPGDGLHGNVPSQGAGQTNRGSGTPVRGGWEGQRPKMDQGQIYVCEIPRRETPEDVIKTGGGKTVLDFLSIFL